MTPAEEAAWDAVHDALPARWRVGPPTFDPGRQAWSVTAVGPHPGRRKLPQTVSGIGADATAALVDLNGRLRGVPRETNSLDEIRARLRLAYVDGAEEWSREHAGRPLAGEELERIIGWFSALTRGSPFGGERG